MSCSGGADAVNSLRAGGVGGLEGGRVPQMLAPQ